MRHVTFLLVVLLCSGCLGREIVGVRPPPEPEVCDDVPFSCDDYRRPTPLPPVLETAFEPEETLSCGVSPATDLCPAVVAMQGIGTCSSRSEWMLDEDTEISSMDFSCSTLSLRLGAGVRVTISDSQFAGSILDVSGGAGSTLSIVRSTGEELQVKLSGQAWLELSENSSFAGLRVDMDPLIEGSALSLSDTQVAGFRVRGGKRSTAHVRRANLANSLIQVGELISEETVFSGGRIQVDRSTIADGRTQDVQMELGTASFIATYVLRSVVHECDVLRFAATDVIDSQILACTGAVEFAGAMVTQSTIEGTVVATSAGFLHATLIPGPDGEVGFDGVDAYLTAFCDTPELTSKSSGLRCVSCDPDIASVFLEGGIVNAPECPSLQAAAGETSLP